LVCESNPIRAQLASSYGFTVVTLEELLNRSDFIISATGNKARRGDLFLKLKDNAYIASVTSANTEFDLSWLVSKAQENSFNHTSTFTLSGKKLHMLCRGNAVNFIYNAVVGPYIYSVQAELMVSAIQLIQGKHIPRVSLIEMALDDMKRIAARWLEVYERMTVSSEIEQDLFTENVEHFRRITNRKSEVIFTVPEPLPGFVGRRMFLEKMHELLSQKQGNPYLRCNISGMGGSGKTELAIRYAWNYRKTYSHVIYITADTTEIIQSTFEAVVLKLGLNLKLSQAGWEKNVFMTL
ncbi:MAG: hypothetical protein AB7F64_08515, partial [Gammaproteobacteria bacterium]